MYDHIRLLMEQLATRDPKQILSGSMRIPFNGNIWVTQQITYRLPRLAVSDTCVSLAVGSGRPEESPAAEGGRIEYLSGRGGSRLGYQRRGQGPSVPFRLGLADLPFLLRDLLDSHRSQKSLEKVGSPAPIICNMTFKVAGFLEMFLRKGSARVGPRLSDKVRSEVFAGLALP